MHEYLLSTNKFQQPKVLEGNDAIYTLIIRLFLLEPGTIQSHPDMGIGIVSKYRYCDEDKLDDLRTDVQNQISKFLPNLSLVDVSIGYSGKLLLIKINIDNKIYVFKTDFDANNMTLADIVSN